MRKIWLLKGFVIVFLFTGCEEPTQTGYIRVSSNPTGASIYLDGDYSGETDRLISDVLVGSHELRLELDDYEPWQGTVVVEEDDTTSIDVELTPSDSINDEFLWTFNADGRVYCCPAIGEDGTIYFVASTYLYALNPDGSLKWRYDAGFRLDFSPAVGPDGTIYIPCDSSMYAVDHEGNLKWEYPTGGDIYSSPAIGLDTTIYFGSKDHNFYAITPQADLKWEYPTYDEIVTCPALTPNGMIYFGSEDHWLYALDTAGELQWKYPIGPSEGWDGNQPTSRWPGHSPAVGPNGQIYAVSGGDLYALSSTGGLLWKYDIDNISGSPVVGPDGTIYFCGEYYPYDEEVYYGIYALKPDGSLKWIEGPKIYSPTVASDSSINLPGHCLNPDGSTRWKSTLGWSYCINIGPDGTIYYGLSTTLYALKSGSQGLANSSWPKFRGDAQNTGRVNIP